LQQAKTILKETALSLGFDACGVARAGRLDDFQPHFDRWLEQGFHAGLAYMERHREKRLDPCLLLPGAKSVIMLAMNYYPGSDAAGGILLQRPKVSKYAWGLDYHAVIRPKLKSLIALLGALFPGAISRGFTDTAPLPERAWAVRAGLGQTGKNASLIIPQQGSFFFLAAVVTTAELEPDTPFTGDLCHNCTLCSLACPTGAITGPGQIDARRCISYHSIENKDPIPQEVRGKNKGWIFGCDTCQDVCPHNRFAEPAKEPAFTPLHGIGEWTEQQWRALQKEEFRTMFVKGNSPIGRISYEKLMDNLVPAGDGPA